MTDNPQLVMRTGPNVGAVFEVRGPTTMGRGKGCTVELADADLSREHCVIEYEAHEYVLRDLKSSNGTFLNGKRIHMVSLRHGDEIAVGKCAFVFERYAARPEAQAQDDALGGSVLASARISLGTPPFDDIDESSTVEQLGSALRKYKLMYRMNEIISRIGRPDHFFALILEQLFDAIPARQGLVLLGANAEAVEVVATLSTKEATAHYSRTMLKRVFQSGEALLVVDALLDDQMYADSAVAGTRARSLICAPLVHADRLHGAIQLHGKAFDRNDLQVVAGVARQAAVALENLRLIEQHSASKP